MNLKWLVVLLLFVGLLIWRIVASVQAQYYYEANVAAEWYLADKSSTIPAKQEHLDKYVAALEQQGLHGRYNALIFPTPNNSFDTNFTALQTLQSRLHEIEGMDARSFEYQTAIQQITAQEQGEAGAMLKELEGTWWLKYHFLIWDWVGFITIMILVTGVCFSGLFVILPWLEANF